MGLEDCDAETLGWWIRFPVAIDGTTYGDASALQQACRRGDLPSLAADALEHALAGTQVDLSGQLRVTIDDTTWRFAWRNRQWWLAAVD
jgi:hypothetical protein